MNKNEIARCKYLGDISINNIDDFMRNHKVYEGGFTDLYLGDYFIALYGNIRLYFRIYGIDSDPGCNKHHLVIVPDLYLEKSYMCNNINQYNKGFIGTKVFEEIIPTVDEKLKKIFGEHLLTTKVLLSDSSCTVKECDVKSILMSEVEVFGNAIYSKGLCTDKEYQLPLFKILKDFCIKQPWFWLRDEDEDLSGKFCGCLGRQRSASASHVFGVRPRFLIG